METARLFDHAKPNDSLNKQSRINFESQTLPFYMLDMSEDNVFFFWAMMVIERHIYCLKQIFILQKSNSNLCSLILFLCGTDNRFPAEEVLNWIF
jgi:hypothetical protein